MAKFKYLGKDNTLVGRFGRLKHGQIVELWETEAEYVRSHPSTPPTWAPVKQATDDEGVGEIVPKVTKHFDLTRVFWLREAFAFLSRQSRPELLAIARAFREIGAKVREEGDCQSMSREALKEMLYGEVKRLKWTDHAEAPVMAAPVATESDEEPADESTEAETSNDEDKAEEEVQADAPAEQDEAPAEDTEEQPTEATKPARERGRPVPKDGSAKPKPRVIKREK